MSQFNDNAVWYGTRKIDFYPQVVPGAPGTASSYAGSAKKSTNVCENCEATDTAYSQNQYNETRQPSGGFDVQDFKEGSCTVQVADVTKLIVVTDGFTIKFDNTNQESYRVISAGAPESQGEFRKQSIRFKKIYNIIAGNLPPLTA